jgi:hypothetical protein
MIGGALSWLKQINKSYEYWKDYKGERVVIRTSETNYQGEDNIVKTEIVEIEGTVDDVQALPPGFMLVDVERKYIQENNSMSFIMSGETMTSPGATGDMAIRSIDRKFISFSSIEELEFSEENEEAYNPMREEDEEDES